MYKIFLTKTFEEKLEKQGKSFKDWFEKILDKLVENPFTGKPLRYEWFREKKFDKYRVYYLIYKEYVTVYFINISEKKDQQKVISSISLLLDFYKEEIEKLLKESSEP